MNLAIGCWLIAGFCVFADSCDVIHRIHVAKGDDINPAAFDTIDAALFHCIQ